MTRCLVIPPVSISNKSVSFLGDVPILAAMRFGALYWDRLHLTNFGGIRLTSLEKEIEACSEFDFIEVDSVEQDFFSIDKVPLYIQLTSDYIKKQTRKKGQICSIFEYDGADLFPMLGNESVRPTQRRKLQVDLLNCISSPAATVRIGEIRRFREKRADELEQLHNAILGVSEKYLKIGDYNEALVLASKEIEGAIGRLERLMSESHWDRARSAFRCNIGGILVDSLPPIAAGGIGSFGIGSFVPIACGVGYGLLQAIVKNARMKPEVTEELAPLTYAFEARRAFPRR